MMRLTFARPSATLVKTFDQDEITLVPEEGLDSNLSLNDSLPSAWNLPWDPFARLTLSVEADGTLLATNVSGDPAIKFKGNVLTSAYLTEGDALAIGNLQVRWGAPDELSDLDLEQLIAEAEALLEEKPEPLSAAPIAAKIRERQTASDRKRAYTAGAVAITLFAAILSLGLFIRVDPTASSTVIDEWALERQQTLRPVTQEITALLHSHTVRPTPHFHAKLDALLDRYDILHDEQAHLLAAQLSELDTPFPAITTAQTLPDLEQAVAAAAAHITTSHADDLKAQVVAFNTLRTTVLDRLQEVLPSVDDRAQLQPIFDQAHITHQEELQIYKSLE
jgi:hypothetical protein